MHCIIICVLYCVSHFPILYPPLQHDKHCMKWRVPTYPSVQSMSLVSVSVSNMNNSMTKLKNMHCVHFMCWNSSACSCIIRRDCGEEAWREWGHFTLLFPLTKALCGGAEVSAGVSCYAMCSSQWLYRCEQLDWVVDDTVAEYAIVQSTSPPSLLHTNSCTALHISHQHECVPGVYKWIRNYIYSLYVFTL